MAAPGFERIDHTADVALRLTAPTRAELFIAAAAGLNALWGLTPAGAAPAEAGEPLTVAGPDTEALLVAWLNELIFQAAVRTRHAAAVREPRLESERFHARVAWAPLDWAACREGHDIKAATYHTLHVTETDDGVTTTVVFDV